MDINDKKPNYALVANTLNVTCDLPVEIIPGHFFQKANDEQIENIQATLDKFSTPNFGRPQLRYEHKAIKNDTSDGYRFESIDDKENWNYYVIQFFGSNNKLHDIELAANILDIGLRFELCFISGGHTWGPSTTTFYNNFPFEDPEPQRLIIEDLKELSAIYNDMENIEEKYPSINQALSMLKSLNSLPPHTEFHILGLFTVIESIITHTPKGAETGDSLTRQIKTKIPLLSHRFSNLIDYKPFFTDVNEDKVWTLLYEYRSNLAHGRTPDFNNALASLKSRNNAESFLRCITKALLRHALIEPQLYMDLQKC
ncbi:MAG: hypothetical protein KAS88_01070 [Deltaproteobacteria bacterium]|nr:hypothetical protein [Deltaproteobacteria bacterium]